MCISKSAAVISSFLKAKNNCYMTSNTTKLWKLGLTIKLTCLLKSAAVISPFLKVMNNYYMTLKTTKLRKIWLCSDFPSELPICVRDHYEPVDPAAVSLFHSFHLEI